jgi:hypothetical protein
VGVKHVHPRVPVAELEDAALRLALDHRVGEFARRQAGARGVVMEEIGVQMERVDQVELKDVDQIDPHEFAGLDLDRVIVIVEGDAIDAKSFRPSKSTSSHALP